MEMLHTVEEKPGGGGKIAWAVASRVRITYTQHLPPKSVGAKIASVNFQVLQLAFRWVSQISKLIKKGHTRELI